MSLAGLRSDDVAIDRLKIKAPRGIMQRVRRELDLADWPQARGKSWIFIRQVRARAPGNRLADALTTKVRNIIESPPGAGDNGLVMRFADFNELLARLLSDLARSRASRQWYWQRWSYLFPLPVGRALSDLMEAHIEHLPAVTAELAEFGELPTIWRKLDRRDAVRLTSAATHRIGLNLPRILSEPFEAEPALVQHVQTEQLLRRWGSTLKGLTPGDPRRRLALVLFGQERFPLLLQTAPLRLLAALENALGTSAKEQKGKPIPESVSTADTIPSADAENRSAADLAETSRQPRSKSLQSPDRPEAVAAARQGEEADKDDRGSALVVDAQSKRQPVSNATLGTEPTVERTAAADAPAHEFGAPRPLKPTADAPLKADRPSMAARVEKHVKTRVQARIEQQPSLIPSDCFFTAQGGLLFLLNFLKRADVQDFIRRNRKTGEFTSGWGWLFRLGQELDLDEADPMADFLALQLGMESSDQLQGLPPLPAREELLILARRLYDRAGLWRPDLLRLEAKVEYTPSHVDLFAPLSSVRLAVRLAGLDLDPGWLPWLGRVVTFHYVDRRDRTDA